MGRMYIDAITLLNNRPTPPDSLDAKGIEGFRCCLRMYNAQIENQIANRDTDVVEVRHAEWIKASCSEKDGDAHCSECNHWDWSDCKYCSECGAKMDAERRTNNDS